MCTSMRLATLYFGKPKSNSYLGAEHHILSYEEFSVSTFLTTVPKANSLLLRHFPVKQPRQRTLTGLPQKVFSLSHIISISEGNICFHLHN